MPRVFDVVGNRIFVGGEYVGLLDETLPPLMLDDVVDSIRGLVLHTSHQLQVWENEDEAAAKQKEDQETYIEALEKQRSMAEERIKAHQAERAQWEVDLSVLRNQLEEARSWAVTTVNQLVKERDEARRYAEGLLAKGYRP